MDIARRYAVDLMKQVGLYSQFAAPLSDDQKKEITKMEIRAAVEPEVYAEIAEFVEKMLDAGGLTGKLDEAIASVKSFAAQRQRDHERAEEARARDQMSLSPEMREFLN